MWANCIEAGELVLSVEGMELLFVLMHRMLPPCGFLLCVILTGCRLRCSVWLMSLSCLPVFWGLMADVS